MDTREDEQVEYKRQQAAIFEKLAEVGHALSNANRLRMISLLSHGQKTIDELAQLTGQSLASASAHMKQLRASHLIVAEKRGRSVHCRLATAEVARVWLLFRDLGVALIPEVREVMRDTFDGGDGVSSLTVLDLHAKLEQAKSGRAGVVLLDLRPEPEFAEGHLPSARSVPFDRLAEVMETLPRQEPLLVYCRGPFCAAAFEGNARLREQEFQAERLRFSVPEWRAAGLPVEGVKAT